MKRFEAPMMEMQKLPVEDVFTASDCNIEALGCYSCYCISVDCDNFECTTHDCGCYTYVDW